MNKKYIIQWTNTANGRAGRGTKLMEQAEAEGLASELNEEYPHIRHESVEATEPSQTPEEVHSLSA
jgi:hypothetical protein